MGWQRNSRIIWNRKLIKINKIILNNLEIEEKEEYELNEDDLYYTKYKLIKW